MGICWLVRSWVYSSGVSLLRFCYGFIIIFHGVNLLRFVVELYGLGALVAYRYVLLVFKWLLRDVTFRVFLNHFALFRRVPRAMQHACLFRTGWRIARSIDGNYRVITLF